MKFAAMIKYRAYMNRLTQSPHIHISYYSMPMIDNQLLCSLVFNAVLLSIEAMQQPPISKLS